MVKCILIKNLFNKNILVTHLDDIKDIRNFLFDMFKYQPKDTIFLYKFINDKLNEESYVTGHLSESDDFLMEKFGDTAYDQLALTIIEHLSDNNYGSKEWRINSIINSIEKFAVQHNIKEPVNKQKLREFLGKLESDPQTIPIIDARDKYIREFGKKKQYRLVQHGGVLVWALEKYIFPKFPSIMQTILFGILEIIDFVLIFLTSLPWAIIPPLELVNWVLDAISFVWSFLRFDIIGMVGSVIAFIPFVGGIIGAIVRIIGKVYHFIGKAKKGVRLGKKGVRVGKIGVHVAHDIKKGKLSSETIESIEQIY